jgi:peroxiredoxin Q/BCP
MVKLFLGKTIEVLVGTIDNPYSNLMKSSLLLILPSFLLSFSSIFAVDTGSDAPSFSLLDQNGAKWHSSDFLNKKNILIFFYPAAMTGGCTKQACSYRDDFAEWQSRDFEIVGVSGDKPENLKLFQKAENLNFTLLSDIDGKTAKAFGVPTGKGGQIQKFIQGERFTLERGVTSKRWTFVISKGGKIIYRNDKVNAAKDSETVLESISKTVK